MITLRRASIVFAGQYLRRSSSDGPTSRIFPAWTATLAFSITRRRGSIVTTVPLSIRMSMSLMSGARSSMSLA